MLTIEDQEQDLGLDQHPGQLQLVRAQHDAAEQRDQQDRRGGKGEGALGGTGVQVAQARKDEREERGGKRRARPRPPLLLLRWHRG